MAKDKRDADLLVQLHKPCFNFISNCGSRELLAKPLLAKDCEEHYENNQIIKITISTEICRTADKKC